jgi:hypothetical protein
MISNLIANSFVDTATLYTPSSTNEYNDPTYASSATISCKICNTNEIVYKDSNAEPNKINNGVGIVANMIVYSLTNIPIESYISYNGIKRFCISTKEIEDKLGTVLYYKSYFK